MCRIIFWLRLTAYFWCIKGFGILIAMFDAVNARKANITKIIDGAGKQPREDLITSSIFGTLRFLTPGERQVALQVLTGANVSEDARIYLWPRFKLEGRVCEPDVVLGWVTADGPRYWIVEVKWGAALQPAQVHREIVSLLHGDCLQGELPRASRILDGYTLLGIEAKHLSDFNTAHAAHPAVSFKGLEWPIVAEALSQASRRYNGGLQAWADAASTFLQGTEKGKVLGPLPRIFQIESAQFHFEDRIDLQCGLLQVPSASFRFQESKET